MAKIINIEIHVPSEKITNLDLSKKFTKWNPDKILEKTGISLRGKSSKNETAGDLAIEAGKKLLINSKIDNSEIGMLLFVTQTPNQIIPCTSCQIHHALDLDQSCGAFDINQGCTGYIYGLYLANSIINNGSAKYVLLLTGDTYTKLISEFDNTCAPIFGDGASATLLGADDGLNSNEKSIGDFLFGTEGSNKDSLYCDFGGFKKAKDDWNNLFMDGPRIMSFTLEIIPKLCINYFKKFSLNSEDFDFVVFHQANKFILQRLYKKLKFEDKGIICLKDFGNTVSSSIPIALKESIMKKKDKKFNILLVGFGVGLSWGITRVVI